MKLNLSCLAAAALLLGAGPAFSQAVATAQNVPELPYKAVPNFFQAPPDDYQGETQGVATNSKGDIFVFFRGNPGGGYGNSIRRENLSARSAKAITASCSRMPYVSTLRTISGP